MKKLRTESVNIGYGTVTDLDVFVVAENTNNVYYLKGVKYREKTYYGTQVERNVNENGVPIKWQENVVAIVNGVPIPKGFVASQATGENTKNRGLVIYEGTDPVTDTNVENAKRTRNQYVWVPVEDFSKFVRQDFGLGYTISNTLGENYWEVVLDTTTNMPLSIQDTNYVTSTTLTEVQAMYASIKEYEGFYIARYEAGLDIGSQKTEDDGLIIKAVHSKMNKAPYNYARWTYNRTTKEDTKGAVEVARSVYPVTNSNYGAVSTLTYSVQRDRTLNWWIETKAQNGTKNVTIESQEDLNDSTLYGNFYTSTISALNEGASASADSGITYTTISSSYIRSVGHLLTTGATEMARINNIYDMAGNLDEWTMAGAGNTRASCGGSYVRYGKNDPVASSTTHWSDWTASYQRISYLSLY